MNTADSPKDKRRRRIDVSARTCYIPGVGTWAPSPLTGRQFILAAYLIHGGLVMNKGNLVDAICNSIKNEGERTTKREVELVVSLAFSHISAALAKKEPVIISRFGAWGIRHRAHRVGRDLRDPTKTIDIPERDVVKFKASKELNSSVRE